MNMKKKVLYIILTLALIFIISGCEGSAGSGNEYEVQSIQMLNEVVNKKLDNFTCNCISTIAMSGNIKNEQKSQELRTTVDENKMHIVLKENDAKIELYQEIENDKVCYYVYNESSWEGPFENTTFEPINFVAILEFGEITEDMFEYNEGVWVGNIEKLEKFLNVYLEKYIKNIAREYQCEIDLEKTKITKFNVEISNYKLKKETIEFVLECKKQEEPFTLSVKYIYNYSRIGTTSVDGPNQYN